MTSDGFGLLPKMALAGSSNMIAACFSNPIDVIKVRMQLEGELSTNVVRLTERKYPGFVKGGAVILKEEGMRGLYRGLVPSLMREGSYSAIRLGAYEPMKEILGASDPLHTPLYKKIMAGAITGAFGSALANPTDLVKIRFQGTGGPRYGSVWSAFVTIAKLEGVGGLWKGVSATMQRAAMVTACQIPSYDHAKQFVKRREMMEEGIGLHIVCSMFAGLVTSTATSPIDVIKTRIMNQGLDAVKPYKGSLDAGYRILETEGVRGLFKGWFPNWMRIGPHTIISFMVYEQLRKAAGLRPM